MRGKSPKVIVVNQIKFEVSRNDPNKGWMVVTISGKNSWKYTCASLKEARKYIHSFKF